MKYQPNLPLGENGEKVTASQEHITLSKNAAKEGMVLLKNDRNVLPMPEGSRIALFGKGTIDYVKGGGGSGDVTVPYIRNICQGFQALGRKVSVFPDTCAFYEAEVNRQYAEGRAPGLVAEPELPDELVTKAKAFADYAVISISRFSGEGWDRKSVYDKIEKHKGVHEDLFRLQDEIFEEGDFYLTRAEKAMVDKVTAAFDKVIVVLNIGGMIDTSWFADNDAIPSVLLAWQGGMEGGLAEAELLMGIGTPSGKLSDTLARRLEDYPSADTFFDSDDYVNYYEDIYVGYRYFETIPGAAEKVVYPFGYGLSYTTFAISRPEITERGGKINVALRVTNIGERPGKEVVQGYFSAPQGKLGKPAKQLAGYKKTRLLSPGERQIVTISFAREDMASFDDLGKIEKSAYVLEKGEYHFFAGSNVRSLKEADNVLRLSEDVVVCKLTSRMAPVELEKRMLSDGSYEALPTGTPVDTDANALEPMKQEEMEGALPATRAVSTKNRRAEKTNHVLEDVADGKITLEELISEMSDEDLCWLMGGQPNTGVANTFGYGNNEQFGIPNMMSADGPAGLRIRPEVGVCATAFPCATLIACTWDPAVAEEIGKAGGAEVMENNIGVWLTPAVNIHRTPLCGRNFEYYSEDPLLTAKQAAAMVRGIQSNRVAATVKHFALNNKETNRKNSDSRASERAIREIYLKAFEIIVRESDPWSIMTSYNIINGHRASENSDMLTGILRDEWGYEGMVTTDWWTCGENYKEVNAGNDMKMGCGWPERLKEAMDKGAMDRSAMELAAKHILNMILKID